MATKKKKSVKKRKKTTAKKSPAKKKVTKKKKAPARAKKKRVTTKRKPAKRSVRRSKASPKKVSAKRSPSRRSAAKRKRLSVKKAKVVSRGLVFNGSALSNLNYHMIENELAKLTDLLQLVRKKSKLVKKSLGYLEKEQKKLAKQIQETKKFLTQLKNRGIRALREFPENAEEIFSQLKGEISRFSRRLGLS